MLIIGGIALMQWMPKYYSQTRKSVKDVDAIIWQSELDDFLIEDEYKIVRQDEKKTVLFKDGVHYEMEIARDGNNQQQLLEMLDVHKDVVEISDLELLYTLKMSHRHLKNSPHFHKTMRDIHAIRQQTGLFGIPEKYKDWYDVRVKDTYDYKHPSLNKSKGDFFDTSVFKNGFVYQYDHDSIHKAVKVGDHPAYTYFMNGEVSTSKQKFMELPENIKLDSVYEESLVLALERAVIPNGMNEDKAFFIALEKVCTSIASGWWRDYAWENYYKVAELYKERNKKVSYKDLFEAGLKNGIVKEFKPLYEAYA